MALKVIWSFEKRALGLLSGRKRQNSGNEVGNKSENSREDSPRAGSLLVSRALSRLAARVRDRARGRNERERELWERICEKVVLVDDTDFALSITVKDPDKSISFPTF